LAGADTDTGADIGAVAFAGAVRIVDAAHHAYVLYLSCGHGAS
jgi:hypothetical protein